jgi:hypothetical protein
VGQHRGRDGVQVDGPEYRQGQGEHQHAHRDPDGGTDQDPPVALGHSDPDPEQHDGNDWQLDPERVEQVERGPGAGEVLTSNRTRLKGAAAGRRRQRRRRTRMSRALG